MSPTPCASRRTFMKQATAGLALSSSAALPLPAIAADGLKNEICTFTKPLQHLSYQDLAKEMAMIGFDGIEAPIRPKGHFEPEQVDDELPLMVEALKNDGLNLTILTSGINEVSDEQRTEAVLKTAADLGVKRFRMAYYKYDLDEPIAPQLDEFRAKLKDLVALTDELGIKPIYQNHSGKNYFGGPLWDLAEVLDD
ncbi:MAG: TIM barrel protein, partial [Verrucomicrobiota bacterium]